MNDAHFCTIRYTIYNYSGVVLSTGICVPLVCKEDDIIYSLGQVPGYEWIPEFYFTAECVQKNPEKLSVGGIITVFFISILGVLFVSGTLIDIYWSRKVIPERKLASPKVKRFEIVDDLEETKNFENEIPKPPLFVEIITAFSFSNNWNKLLNHYPNDKTNLNPLNSLRLIAMLWVILGHTVLFTIFIGYTDSLHIIRYMIPSTAFQIILNATFSVDVFFYLSGFLTTYFVLKELRQRNGHVNWILMIIHRIWRLTPMMILALFFFWQVIPTLGNGPWWSTFMKMNTVACENYWWTNLLYINNFWNFDMEQTCLAWSWYLSTDMQFYLISPIFIFILYKWPKWGFVIIAVLSAGSLSYVAVISSVKDLSPSPLLMDDGFKSYLYTKPWARISTFFIGMLYAYFLLEHEESQQPYSFRKLKFIPQTIFLTSAWILSLFLILFPIFITQPLYKWQGEGWSTAKRVAYLTLSRPSFTIGLANAFHLIMTSQSSVSFKSALSHPIWTPFARLTFGAYLYHPMIIFMNYFSKTRPIDMDGSVILMNWISFSFLSYLASLISFLIIEKPTENLEQIFSKKMKKKKQKDNLEDNLENGMETIQIENNKLNETQEIGLSLDDENENNRLLINS